MSSSKYTNIQLLSSSTTSSTSTPDHSQNTDTGTTSTTFQIDSNNSGPKIKNNSNILEVKNSNDTSYISIKASTFKTGDNTLTIDETKTLSNKLNIVVTKVLQSTTDSLTSIEISNTIISNYGQTVENTQTLPACTEGYSFMVQIETTGMGNFHLKPGSTDKFYFDGTSLDNGDKITCVDPEIGDYLVVGVIKTGESSFDWIAESGRGSWIDGGS